MNVVELMTNQTYPLRLAVLRHDTPTKDVSFPEDDWDGTWHLGLADEAGAIVATSSWVPRACPQAHSPRAIQLRGMATAAALQGTGLGGNLLEAGIERCIDLGFGLVWANARDSALGFYVQHNCAVLGEGFIDDNTQLPHHVVVRHLK